MESLKRFFSSRNLLLGGIFTAAMVGAGYYDAMQEEPDPNKPPPGSVPAGVVRVLPNGAWVMADGTIVNKRP